MKKLILLFTLLISAFTSYSQYAVKPKAAQSSRMPAVGELEKSFDGSTTTYYQTTSSTTLAVSPDVVDYYFTGAKSINKINYTPRNATNGRWLTVDIYYATTDDLSNFIFSQTVSWANSTAVKTVDYTSAIVKPAIIRFVVKSSSGTGNTSTCAEMTFSSAEEATASDCTLSGTLASFNDTKVTPSSTSTNTEQSTAEAIDMSVDGNFATMYHSGYSFVVGADNPAILTYNFVGNPTIDYLVYYPRQDVSNNGNFGEIEVRYQLNGQSNYTTWFNYDAQFNSGASYISFPFRLTNVVSIQLRVKSGYNNNAACAEMMFYTKQFPDTKITPTSANANTFNSTSENAQKSIDADFSTLYHSTYSFVVSELNPAILTYDFSGSTSIDYLVYYPRGGTQLNGNFGAFDVQYRLAGESAYTTISSVDAAFSKFATTVHFPSTLTNVESVRIIVKSGYGNYASASEVMFYQSNGLGGTVSGNVFVDDLYSALKPGTTQAEVDVIGNTFFKTLANCMLNGTYNYKYRVREYNAYKVVSNLSATLKTSTYNQFENPTGIMFEVGKEVNVFVDLNATGKNLALKVIDMRVHNTSNTYTSSTYALKPGINVINITTTGLGYIDYYTDDVNAEPIKMHIVGGAINGLYRSQTDGSFDWMDAVNSNTAYSQIDIEGNSMNLLFDKAILKKYNPINIAPLINLYDSIAKLQFNMMGFSKYNIKFKNHLFGYAHSTGGLYAGGLGTHYDYSWGESKYTSVDGILNSDNGDNIWGIAHEIGHINQMRPGLKWAGMSEVSNNIFSTYVQYTMGLNKGLNGRLERESINPYESSTVPVGAATTAVVGGRYKGFFDRAIIYKGNHISNNNFGRVIPFWQLQLYYQFAGALKGAPTLEQRMSGTAAAPAAGTPDYAFFLADVMQAQRNRNESGLTDETLVLNFVKDVCDVTKEDLTDYFKTVGILKPIDTVFDDYGTKNYKITQAAIDAAVLSIKSKGYAAPVSPVLHYLSANSLNAFKNQLIATGTYKVGTTLSGSNANRILTVNHSSWQNVVAFESYKTDHATLLEVTVAGMRSAANTQTVIRYPVSANTLNDPDWVYAVSFDGTKKLVYSRTDISVLPVTLTSFNATLQNNNVVLKWKTSAEKNNRKFELLKSTDGITFVKIAEVEGAGTKETPSTYQYLDKDFSKSAYYKLSQIDLDGNTITFDEHTQYVKGLDVTINVFPNPTSSKLYINLEGTTITSVKLTDMMGKEVRRLSANSGSLTTLDLSGLPNGLYTLQLFSEGKIETRKIVKQ